MSFNAGLAESEYLSRPEMPWDIGVKYISMIRIPGLNKNIWMF